MMVTTDDLPISWINRNRGMVGDGRAVFESEVCNVSVKDLSDG